MHKLPEDMHVVGKSELWESGAPLIMGSVNNENEQVNV